MLCLINEPLYARQGITPPQTVNNMQMIRASVKRGLQDCCDHQACMGWLTFNGMFQCRNDVQKADKVLCGDISQK